MRASAKTLLSNPRVQAAIIAALALAVYLRTLAPTVMWYDMGEFATAAYVLGIAHNTGYPLLMILGKLFTYLPVGDIAYRVNLLSAVCAALTVMVLYWIVFELTTRRTAAALAAFTLAFSSTLWSNATWATSYDLNAFLTILILWLMLRWRQTARPGYLQAAALTFGLSLGNHRLILTVALAAAFLIWREYRQGRWSGRTLTLALLFLAGFSVNLYLPLRAAQQSPVLWADASDLQTFLTMVVSGYAGNFINPFESVGGLRSVFVVLTIFPVYEFTLVGLILAGVGAWRLLRLDRDFLVASALIVLAAGVMVSVYGIHNIFNYFQPIYLVLASWFGVGAQQTLLAAGEGVGARMGDRLKLLTPLRREVLATALLAGLPLVLFGRSFNIVDRSQHREASDFAHWLLSRVESRSVILADFWSWSPLLYAQVVEGRARSVLVTNALSEVGLDQQALIADLNSQGIPVYVAYGIDDSPRLKVDLTRLQLIAPFAIHYYPTYGLPLPEFKDLLVPKGSVYKAIAGIPELAVGEVPTEAQQQANFGEQLRLRGFQIQPLQIARGEAFRADYFWSLDSETKQDYWVDVQFTDEAGNIATRLGLPIWLHSHWVGGEARGTSIWAPDQIMRESYDGLVPRSVQPGTYWIWATVYEDPNRDRLVGPEEGVRLGSITVLGE